ncbi:hypothetical protein ZIOFF_024494 [Zingiber officinale]|uniref:Transposase-associated domain-containing protein n=1 Tax=Zingiber officinale TaxID=94328 RepID=A0A8J5GYC2_ZINOF|nr:hypothetical protein ZIOFF_024494 [Zingiber officinale]
MASTQRLKLFQGSQAFPSNLHLHLLSKLGILRNLGDKESCKSNAFPTMFQGVHDPNEEKVVKSLRGTLLSKGQLPEKYDDYHTLLRFLFFSADFCDCGTSTCLRQRSCLLICSGGEIVLVFILLQKFWILYRAKQDGPVVLGWRHPWEGHGDHSHDHVPEDKVLYFEFVCDETTWNSIILKVLVHIFTGIVMDKGWMFLPRQTEEYRKGLENFLDFAFSNANINETIACPCARCKIGICVSREEAYDHLTVDGFIKGYTHWVAHGETTCSAPSISSSVLSRDDVDNMEGLVHDAFGVQQHDGSTINTAGFEKDKDIPFGEAEKFYKLIDDSQKELYPGSDYVETRFNQSTRNDDTTIGSTFALDVFTASSYALGKAIVTKLYAVTDGKIGNQWDVRFKTWSFLEAFANRLLLKLVLEMGFGNTIYFLH